MANDISVAIGKIFAQGFLALRQTAAVLMSVNKDFSNEVAQRGDTIDIVIPSARTVTDVTPSPTPPTGQDTVLSKVAISLSNWKKADMFLTDKQVAEIANYPPGIINQQVSEAVKALVNKVAADMYAEGLGVYSVVGTPGTTPFGTGVETASATDLRKALNKTLAPMDPRFAIIDPDAEGAALQLRAFQDASFAGTVEGIRDGQINRKMGFVWLMDQLIPTMTNGTLSDGAGHKALVQGAGSIGITSKIFDAVALTGTVEKGEVFTVAGDTQQYVVLATATAAANAITLTFAPAAKVAWADNAQMTLLGAASQVWVQNLGFHRDAFALAIRPLGTPEGFTGGNIVLSAQDSMTGIPLRLEVERQHKQNLYTWDILYGVKLVRPELAARLAG